MHAFEEHALKLPCVRPISSDLKQAFLAERLNDLTGLPAFETLLALDAGNGRAATLASETKFVEAVMFMILNCIAVIEVHAGFPVS
ncbi:hypothetical protein [Pararhizobium arenae]|uniref:hypothetical protein n=1 Tax=Pararhizobium arenae TaxID=1856850 RepID=UPI00094AA356|nr:hypothetical protein [Pararhizobium arenae]